MGRKSEPLFISSERIKELLKQKKLKQKDLAKELGYSPESVSRFLKRKVVENNLAIQKIADFLEVEPAYISDNYESPPENLNHLTSDQLRNLSNACNEILQKRSMEKEVNEFKKIKEKYEGKFILVDDVLFYIVKFKNPFWYEYYSFGRPIGKLPQPELNIQFIHGESGWLFVDEHPTKAIIANKKRSVPIDRARIISQDEAERIIDEMFSNIKSQMFQNKNESVMPKYVNAKELVEFLDTYPLDNLLSNPMNIYRDTLKKISNTKIEAVPLSWIKGWTAKNKNNPEIQKIIDEMIHDWKGK